MILGGQPGSGKSTLMHITKNETDNGVGKVGLASDDYRHFHPRYDKILRKYPQLAPLVVSPDAELWANKIMFECMEKKVGLVLEGTMGKTSWAAEKEKKLKENGYSVEYRVMAVNPLLSKISTFNRYAEMERSGATPRFVTAAAHDERFDGLKQSITGLASVLGNKISLYTREIKFNQKNGFSDIVVPLNPSSVDPLLDFKQKISGRLSFYELDYISKSISILQASGFSKEVLKEAFPNFIRDNHRQTKI